MKESVIDVLMYLFESYIDGDSEPNSNREELQSILMDAGFANLEIEKAFDWLEDLASYHEKPRFDLCTPESIRLYHDKEVSKIDTDCRGFLLFLEQMGVLSASSRELVIERIMALDTDGIDLEQLKWVVLMVLFNIPGEEAAYRWMEDIVFEPASSYLH
jgi:Smg protein